MTCRRVNARRRAECVAPEDRIVDGNRPAATRLRRAAVVAEFRQIVVDPVHQFEIDEQLIHRRIADAFADAERRAVNLIRPGLNRRDGIDDA
jgi:hypothetical protein